MLFQDLMRCTFGPRLYRIRRFKNEKGRVYKPSHVEAICQTLLSLANSIIKIIFHTFPLVIIYFYIKHDLKSITNCLNNSLKWIIGTGVFFIGCFIIQGLKRWTNNDYFVFSQNFDNSLSLLWSPIQTKKKLLSFYDFDFSYWPPDFKMPKDDQILNQNNQKLKSSKSFKLSILIFTLLLKLYKVICFLKKEYEVKYVIDGRNNLIENERYKGQRFKLLTKDLNEIDSLFIDWRNKTSTNGNTLVICCEGVAGHYECGISCTPLRAGYSVLGWNHPSYGESTGSLFPDQDQNAIDVVIKFANEKLGFKFEKIILFGWSFGGYAASWATMKYPNLGGLVLDATFDIFHLVIFSRMPKFFPSLWAQNKIKKYFFMNNTENLANYHGPVLIIRRTRDERLSTNKAKLLESNRTNFLLTKLLQQRFPDLMTDEENYYALMSWLANDPKNQEKVLKQHHVDNEKCLTLLKNLISSNQTTYPITISDAANYDEKVKLVLFLANKYLISYDSTHTDPLPAECFLRLWNLFSIFQ